MADMCFSPSDICWPGVLQRPVRSTRGICAWHVSFRQGVYSQTGTVGSNTVDVRLSPGSDANADKPGRSRRAKSCPGSSKPLLPVYPEQRTLTGSPRWSVWCQRRNRRLIPLDERGRRLRRRDLVYLLKARLEQYHQTSMGFQARK